MTRRIALKQDRTRRGGHAHSLSIQDHPIETLTPAERLRRRVDMALLMVTRHDARNYADVTGSNLLQYAIEALEKVRETLPEDPLQARKKTK